MVMIPECLKIEDSNLRTYLDNIEIASKRYWESPALPNYTRHGPDHSARIVDILGILLQYHSKKLNDHERFILVAAAYLHDIGMQFPQYVENIGIKSEYTSEESEKIRNCHNETSAKVIRDNAMNIQLGIDQCKDYAGFIAEVSRYHRSLDLSELEDTFCFNGEIKLSLLAALLRLGDGLDADFNRINIDILKSRDIPVESKYHWWAHHYVQSINTINGVITITFRFPMEYNGIGTIEALRQEIIKSIRDQYIEVYDILYKNGIALYRELKIAKDASYSKYLEPIPEELQKYLIEQKKDKFLCRYYELKTIKKCIIYDYSVSKVVLVGQNGMGKTELANAVRGDEGVLEFFRDGVIWLAFDQNTRNSDTQTLNKLLKIIRCLTEKTDYLDTMYSMIDEGSRINYIKNYIKENFSDKACLLILDDIKNADQIKDFDLLGPRSRMIITTRKGVKIAKSFQNTKIISLHALDRRKSHELLAYITNQDVDRLTEKVKNLADSAKGIPLKLVLLRAEIG